MTDNKDVQFENLANPEVDAARKAFHIRQSLVALQESFNVIEKVSILQEISSVRNVTVMKKRDCIVIFYGNFLHFNIKNIAEPIFTTLLGLILAVCSR